MSFFLKVKILQGDKFTKQKERKKKSFVIPEKGGEGGEEKKPCKCHY